MQPFNIKELAEKAGHSLETFKQHVGTSQGRLYTWNRDAQTSQIPEWVQEHAFATRLLRAVIERAKEAEGGKGGEIEKNLEEWASTHVKKEELKKTMKSLSEAGMPEWAVEQVAVIKALNQALEQAKSSGEKIPEDIREVIESSKMPEWAREHIIATRDLQRGVIAMQRVGEQVEGHIFELLEACNSEVRKLALLVNYAEYLHIVLEREPHLSPEGLLLLEQPVQKEDFEWNLNMGLLMNTYNRTNDEAVKNQIGFLILHYLAKAAPIDITPDSPSFERHLGFRVSGNYAREEPFLDVYFWPAIQKAHSYFKNVTDFFLLDSEHWQEFLPLSYSVITSETEATEEAWAANIEQAMSDYIQKGVFSRLLEPPMIFDFTKEVGDLFTASEEKLQKTLIELEQKVEKAIALAGANLRKKYPGVKLSDRQLRSIIRTNSTCISGCQVKGLPIAVPLAMLEYFEGVYNRSTIESILENRFLMFDNLVNKTGIRLGAVRARKILFEFIDDISELSHLTEYHPIGKNTLYYEQKSDLTGTELFKRFTKRLEEKDFEGHPEVMIQGKAVVHLFNGLLQEIPDHRWGELNTNPDTRMLIQSTLFRFMQHIARAENNMNRVESSFEARIAFAKSMELAQAEMSTLLAVFSPFEEQAFQDIYRAQLTHIPKKLQEYLHVGVGKSGMNVFASVNLILAQTTEARKPERVISEGTYFEETQVIGKNRTPKAIAQNLHINQVDLYVGEFIHNISSDQTVHHYEVVDIIGEVEYLLIAKPETKQLTVLVDETIDFVRSEKVMVLLKHFSKEIEDGKLNFVFFRSGQKFDMLGMDNYYGAPFYMVNNGDAHWKAFEGLTTHPLFQTDSLSMQWFCLANRYAFQDMEDYRAAIFHNTREVLNRVPEIFTSGKHPSIQVSTADKNMDACFIDIKFTGQPDEKPDLNKVWERIQDKFEQNKQIIHTRDSFGFPHTNLSGIMSADDEFLALRITMGLDRADIQLISEFFEELAEEMPRE